MKRMVLAWPCVLEMPRTPVCGMHTGRKAVSHPGDPCTPRSHHYTPTRNTRTHGPPWGRSTEAAQRRALWP
jgi:hypothetical protein